MNEVRNVNWMHRQICNGVLSEMDILIKKPIDEYGAILDAYRYDLDLKRKASEKNS